ncbi:MAG: MBL fold metallo-hydrolase [Anaerolineae bacterium]|jgi:glyoxylase-like metal-dependent hydrolase (beta-lactamase superfamily II)|nr:MBL fold metallo-hydrolase [Anaerolineae bacterium]
MRQTENVKRQTTNVRVAHRAWFIVLLGLLAVVGVGCGGGSAETPAASAPTAVETLAVTPTPAPLPPITPTPALRTAYPRFKINEEMEARVIQEGVFLVTHAFPWPHNSLMVWSDATLLLVDTPYTPEATETMLRWFKEQRALTQPGESDYEIAAINTGFHYDNLGGNRYLVDQGIPVYGSELTARLIEERGEALRELTLTWLAAPADRRYYEAHEQLSYVAPTERFDVEEGLELTFGGEPVQVLYPGPSHTPDNVVVYFPARKLLFGGCMILGGDEVGNTADADMEAWPESVRRLMDLDVDLVVPGHGDRLDPGLIAHTVELLTE